MATTAHYVTMATTAHYVIARPGPRSAAADLRELVALIACTGLPLGLFGLVNLGAEALGILPLFFAPFGLPGWVGAVIHLAQLALLGTAFWTLLQSRGTARYWLAALTLGYVFLPFITPPLDSLQLALTCSALFLLSLATLVRVGAVSPLGGWLMAPMLFILGFSASMGLAITAAYTPPFALVQANEAPPAA